MERNGKPLPTKDTKHTNKIACIYFVLFVDMIF